MKLLSVGCAAALVLVGCKSSPTTAPATSPAEVTLARPALAWPAGLPVYDHVVIVVEENKNYEQVIGKAEASYINRLRREGANLTQMYGEEHHSEGNYFWLLSGSNQGFCCLDPNPASFTRAPNLGQALIDTGRLTFKGYAEDLPAIGSTVFEEGLYARKHVPWITFSNVPNGRTVATSSNLRFIDFPSDYEALPTVSFVIPNLSNDMHDVHNGDVPGAVRAGSTWLEQKLDPYYQWAKTHNSLLIVTFDENDKHTIFGGPTDPAAQAPSDRNRIVTILAGARIKAGEYAEGAGVNHVNLLRTLEAMYGLPRSGAQQPLAEKAGISDTYLITDVFEAGQSSRNDP